MRRGAAFGILSVGLEEPFPGLRKSLSPVSGAEPLPWELWLSLAEERVTRADLREVPSLSELSVCSGSVEKSESSVPSELLPAFLCNSTSPQSTHI